MKKNFLFGNTITNTLEEIEEFITNDSLQAYFRMINKIERKILNEIKEEKSLNQLIKLKMYYQDQLLETNDIKYFNLINDLDNEIIAHY